MRHIDGHQILGTLGQGGMSRVLKVRSATDGQIHALKLLAPHPNLEDLLGMTELQRRFRFEAEVLQQVDHPHVVRLIAAQLSRAQWYVLLEYHCRTVSEWIGEGSEGEEATRSIRPDLALNVARQTALALQTLHDRGLVHRDVKPANLLLDANRVVKLADFGLSKLRGEWEIQPPQMVVGSPFYAPPEQERRPESVDQRADWYSLGVVLFRLISGRLPGKNPDWRLVTREFGPAGEEVLSRILAVNPANRPDQATEVLAGLERMERFWLGHREASCRLRWQDLLQNRRQTTKKTRLRNRPLKVGAKGARQIFPVTALWQTNRHRATILVAEGEIIRDQQTGLIWQQAGSPDPLEWTAAQAYADQLNRENWAGRRSWRLPTADELLSLLQPDAPLDDFCLQPLFDRRQHRLWSADRRSFIAAWIVDVESGYLGWQDFTCPAFVRAVSSDT